MPLDNFLSFSGGIDFIGDIHGCYSGLERLLLELGYTLQEGCFRYTGRYRDSSAPRKVIFLGDVVDRGPQIRECLECVHAMVEAGEALMLMGNHEFHALSYFIERPDRPDEYIRSHTEHHYQLLAQTLHAFDGDPERWDYFRQWLLARPVFIEHDNYRAVHACWDDALITRYQQDYQRSHMDLDFVKGYCENSFNYDFIERLMRGIELELPSGVYITGTDGKKRSNFRARFWLEQPQTYDQVIFRPHMLPRQMRGVALDQAQIDTLVYYKPDDKPLFLGHYWQTGEPAPLTDNIACVDYSAVRGGKLAAYRFDGERTLEQSRFVAVDVESAC